MAKPQFVQKCMNLRKLCLKLSFRLHLIQGMLCRWIGVKPQYTLQTKRLSSTSSAHDSAIAVDHLLLLIISKTKKAFWMPLCAFLRNSVEFHHESSLITVVLPSRTVLVSMQRCKWATHSYPLITALKQSSAIRQKAMKKALLKVWLAGQEETCLYRYQRSTILPN